MFKDTELLVYNLNTSDIMWNMCLKLEMWKEERKYLIQFIDYFTVYLATVYCIVCAQCQMLGWIKKWK
jgi:hypothetical protein